MWTIRFLEAQNIICFYLPIVHINIGIVVFVLLCQNQNINLVKDSKFLLKLKAPVRLKCTRLGCLLFYLKPCFIITFVNLKSMKKKVFWLQDPLCLYKQQFRRTKVLVHNLIRYVSTVQNFYPILN